MLDHVSLGTRDLTKAHTFYNATLAALGMSLKVEGDSGLGYGTAHPEFWTGPAFEGNATPGTGVHICLRAPAKQAVDDFYTAGLTHGGHDNGPSGLRPHYLENYYAAFLFDPDGNKIEAVHYLKDDR